MARESNTFGYLMTFIGAAAVGAGAALLFAPATGRDTRKLLARRLEEQQKVLKKKGAKALDEWTEYASDQLQQGKEKIADFVRG
jgi:gas vesicle protein